MKEIFALQSAPRSDVLVLAQPIVPVPLIPAATSPISVPVREVVEQEQGKSRESQETEEDAESRNASGEESNGEEEETRVRLSFYVGKHFLRNFIICKKKSIFLLMVQVKKTIGQ